MTGGEFRQLREGLDCNQAELAALMGTTRASVSRWEANERPISELVARFLRLLVKTQGKRTGGR
jgi:DNA-binding transcriptional regulator YiaG